MVEHGQLGQGGGEFRLLAGQRQHEDAARLYSILAALAAAYGHGLARNHPFVDGNKRAAFLAIGLFLALNGQRLRADRVEAIHTILALAAGTLSETQLAIWIRANLGPK